MGPTWIFRIDGVAAWDWSRGDPPLRRLKPVRRPAADAMSRHTPVRIACQTTGSTLLVESTLELEAARSLDRDCDVEWIVAQPVAIQFDDGRTHVVDLLAVHTGGKRVLWDVRPDVRQNDKFRQVAALTREATASVGWGYEVFGTQPNARRLNVMWLATFRRPPKWPHARIASVLLRTAAPGVALGALLALDEGDGHLIATMWHLIWTGDLAINVDEPLTANSRVSIGGVSRA
ncbi:TnsA-like heteromeric transposase endonuclease subunit [Paraoerskovia marina]|uniref:TnsA-like heteromeric transposase endonuclease subunit n=1 Tax=Paraoerskovia marina TaxID=545619 RepID=UPI0009E035D9|nr:TnsA-like heteromeric transposase endonuclease subunit [Paraoerskovia marina]